MHAIYEDRSYDSNLPVVAFESRNIGFFAHWHEDVELICVCEGSLQVGINNESRILRRGDMAVCSSGDIHFYDCRGQECILRLIIFRPEMVDSTGGWPRAFEFCSPFLQDPCHAGLYDRFNGAFETLRQETERSDGVSPMLVRSSLLGLCAMLARNVPTRPLEPDKASRKNHRLKGMQDALSYIERNYTDTIGLKDAAAAANMSVFHFSRIFGSVTGAGFKEYLNRLRVDRAEELLRNSDASVTEIAYQCGFNSIRTFNRIFLSSRGVPPSKAR